MCCMCTWHRHMNNDLCALMWKSEEVEHLPLLLSTSSSGGMVHHEPAIPLSSCTVWPESSWDPPVSASKCWGYTATFAFSPVFIFMCLCAMHLCMHVWGHVHAWTHMCGGTHVDGRLRSMLNHLPSITFPPYWKGKNVSWLPRMHAVA